MKIGMRSMATNESMSQGKFTRGLGMCILVCFLTGFARAI